jgi:hypothetical protein
MKRFPLFVLLFLISCQELTSPNKISSAASTSLDIELFDGPWIKQDQACDLSNNNCTDIDRSLTFTSTKMNMKVYYRNTLTSFPGMSKVYTIVSSTNGGFKMNTGSNIVQMNYTINGNTLELCDDLPVCYTYQR